VAGEDQTLDSGAAHVQHQHVEDDPDGGVPIEHVSAAELTRDTEHTEETA
jgi:hypothetical protein